MSEAIDANRAPTEPRSALYTAVKYTLDRAQFHDVNFRWLCSEGTETFHLLCEAEAAHLGLPYDRVRANRAERSTLSRMLEEPDVKKLRKRIEELEDSLDFTKDVAAGGVRETVYQDSPETREKIAALEDTILRQQREINHLTRSKGAFTDERSSTA